MNEPARRAAELTDQMLAFSGKGHFELKEIDLRVVIEDVSRLLRSSVPKKIALRLDLPKDTPAIKAEPIPAIAVQVTLRFTELIRVESCFIKLSEVRSRNLLFSQFSLLYIRTRRTPATVSWRRAAIWSYMLR